jgi:2,3-bisphosphoglycerate-dependent phosphoglycerate mutase
MRGEIGGMVLTATTECNRATPSTRGSGEPGTLTASRGNRVTCGLKSPPLSDKETRHDEQTSSDPARRITVESGKPLHRLGRRPPLPKGIEEAKAAGKKLAEFTFDRAFSSVLARANETLRLVLETIGQTTIPIEKDKALNERMYGELQGLNKAETAKKFGDEQVKIWRRSYDVRPPGGESLKDTAERVLPYYESRIKPYVLKGETILIAAHGNSLRALVMQLEQLTREQVLELNIPTGAPLLYELDHSGKVLSHRYL